MKVLLLAALPREVRPFLRRARARRRPEPHLPAWDFDLGGGTGVAAATGMGPAAAARAAGLALARWRPETLVSLGFGGSLTPEVPPGAVVLGEACWQYHPEAGELESVPAPPPPRPLADLLARLRQAGLPALTGNLVTTPHLIHKAREARPLAGLARPVLDLETAPLAALAAARGLAFLGLRAVTDGAGEELPDFLRQALGPGREPGPAAALAWVAADPRRLLPLLHLWRRARTAARNLAQALEVVLPLL